MNRLLISIVAGCVMHTQAYAESCYDLWYQRNSIYAEYGYCFKTELGKQTFGLTCDTSNPPLTKDEKRRISQIKAEERRRGCKVQ